MRIARAIGIIGLSCVVGFGCAARSVEEPASYVVRAHDTLFSIAWRHDLDYRDLAHWNHIGPDYHIMVGQVLTLRPPERASAAAPRGAGPAAAARAPSSVKWVWPTAHAAAPRPVPGGGVLLLGELGQPIRAAAAGRIVYVGNGLRAYGNLIIIKHADNLLSAYAHLAAPSVREGQQVGGGETIAGMGEGPHQVAALYFEIRLNGKPVDPLPYLSDSK